MVVNVLNFLSLKELHDKCYRNRQHLTLDNRGKTYINKCGCFSCIRIFQADEILRYADGGETILCPYCTIDSVIVETKDIKVNLPILNRLYLHYFKSLEN